MIPYRFINHFGRRNFPFADFVGCWLLVVGSDDFHARLINHSIVVYLFH